MKGLRAGKRASLRVTVHCWVTHIMFRFQCVFFLNIPVFTGMPSTDVERRLLNIYFIMYTPALYRKPCGWQLLHVLFCFLTDTKAFLD